MSLRLAYKLDDTVIIQDVKYTVNASFDNIIRLIDLMNSEIGTTEDKVKAASILLFGQELPFEIEETRNIVQVVIDMYLDSAKEAIYDLAGNEITEKVKQAEKPVIDLDFDADYIYSAFIQAYGIDLIEEQGKLHWFKFRALLKSLPENTKFQKIVGYRSYEKPLKSDTHHKQMMKLKHYYALPNGQEDDESEGVEDYG